MLKQVLIAILLVCTTIPSFAMRRALMSQANGSKHIYSKMTHHEIKYTQDDIEKMVNELKKCEPKRIVEGLAERLSVTALVCGPLSCLLVYANPVIGIPFGVAAILAGGSSIFLSNSSIFKNEQLEFENNLSRLKSLLVKAKKQNSQSYIIQSKD